MRSARSRSRRTCPAGNRAWRRCQPDQGRPSRQSEPSSVPRRSCSQWPAAPRRRRSHPSLRRLLSPGRGGAGGARPGCRPRGRRRRSHQGRRRLARAGAAEPGAAPSSRRSCSLPAPSSMSIALPDFHDWPATSEQPESALCGTNEVSQASEAETLPSLGCASRPAHSAAHPAGPVRSAAGAGRGSGRALGAGR
jgi:hypothetical protein